ncbi:hypothetical protein [Gardnerella vaginalis]|uniref:hypothetical protein n=1 Tax=Gardnerella vaginalis TaxID=2702 RepID=UPI0002634596|nr:hypothetical protein [Gardnerella vaginalis]EIK74241.1 hypothetical protein CGSMWGv284V_06104 [Gardnerella vaginalis 284V]
MMNKKAIAAFAAGATLLAGFAMATPAMANEESEHLHDQLSVIHAQKNVHKDQRALNKAARTLALAKGELAVANGRYAAAKAASDAADKAVEDAKKAKDDAASAYAEKKIKADNSKKFDEWKTAYDTDNEVKAEREKLQKAIDDAQAKVDAKTHSYVEGKTTQKGKTLKEVAEALKTIVDAAQSNVEVQQASFDAAQSTLNFDQQYLKLLTGGDVKPDQTKPDQTKPDQTKPDQTTPDHTKPVQTADPTKSAASAELMRTQVVLAEADATNKDAQEKFVKSKADFEAAKTQMAALDAQVKSAADREEALRVAGKTDTDAYKAAVIDLKAAQSKANAYRTHEYANAEKDFGEKSGKALLAAAAYNAALVNYRAAYNKAVEVEASAVKGFADPNTLNPVSTDFPAAPAAAKAEAKKVEAKAEAKAAAPAGVAGKAAAAKGELAGMGAKGGNGHGGKAGEKLGNAGVGVALTALAASMLAGMGAAVRKMRH